MLGSCDVAEVKDKVLLATVLAWLVPVNRLGNSRGVGRRVKGGGRENYPPEIRLLSAPARIPSKQDPN